jgi:predicted Zn-dependent protease
VFAKSTADAQWPPNQIPEQLEPAFVQGVRTAVAGFLAGKR